MTLGNLSHNHLIVCLNGHFKNEEWLALLGFLIPWERFRTSLAIAVVPPNDTWHLSCNQLMCEHSYNWSHILGHWKIKISTDSLFVCLVKVSPSEQYFLIPWERFRTSLAIAVVPPNDARHLSRNQLMLGHLDKWSHILGHWKIKIHINNIYMFDCLFVCLFGQGIIFFTIVSYSLRKIQSFSCTSSCSAKWHSAFVT